MNPTQIFTKSQSKSNLPRYTANIVSSRPLIRLIFFLTESCYCIAALCPLKHTEKLIIFQKNPNSQSVLFDPFSVINNIFGPFSGLFFIFPGTPDVLKDYCKRLGTWATQ